MLAVSIGAASFALLNLPDTTTPKRPEMSYTLAPTLDTAGGDLKLLATSTAIYYAAETQHKLYCLQGSVVLDCLAQAAVPAFSSFFASDSRVFGWLEGHLWDLGAAQPSETASFPELVDPMAQIVAGSDQALVVQDGGHLFLVAADGTTQMEFAGSGDTVAVVGLTGVRFYLDPSKRYEGVGGLSLSGTLQVETLDLAKGHRRVTTGPSVAATDSRSGLISPGLAAAPGPGGVWVFAQTWRGDEMYFVFDLAVGALQDLDIGPLQGWAGGGYKYTLASVFSGLSSFDRDTFRGPNPSGLEILGGPIGGVSDAVADSLLRLDRYINDLRLEVSAATDDYLVLKQVSTDGTIKIWLYGPKPALAGK